MKRTDDQSLLVIATAGLDCTQAHSSQSAATIAGAKSRLEDERHGPAAAASGRRQVVPRRTWRDVDLEEARGQRQLN